MNISKKLLLGPVCIALLTISLGVASLLSLRHVKYALVFAVLVVSFVVINWLIAKSISNPIKALQKGVEIVGTGNLDYRISTSGTDEIAQLARSFDAMVISLKTLTVSRDRLNQELAERKLVVEELRRSEAQFKAIYESSNDAMVLLADEGFVECNRRAVEMFGYTGAQMERASRLRFPSLLSISRAAGSCFLQCGTYPSAGRWKMLCAKEKKHFTP